MTSLSTNTTAQNNSQKGFTLLELVIVIGLMALTVGVTGDILLSLVRSYTTTQIETELEQNANFVLLKLEKELRNAESVSEISDSSLSFFIKDANNSEVKVVYSVTNGVVTRQVGAGSLDTLTNTSNSNGVLVNCSPCFSRVGSAPPDIIKISMEFDTKSSNINAPVTVENTIIVRKSY